MKTVGLYIHIPFCERKCNYCSFYSIKASDVIFDEYMEKLSVAIDFWADKLMPCLVDTVYIGGGTPSVMGSDRLIAIIDRIKSTYHLSDDPEITIEVNPNSSNKLDFNALSNAGINRISMGLQTSDDDELRLLGRVHTRQDAIHAIELIKKAGISNFSLDVMLGIPHQTMDTLKSTLDFCIDSGADHISTYMLKIEKGTPFYFNKDNLIFADEDAQADMYEFTSQYLKKHGFRHYEISNFCRNDKISRHNTKYWTLDDYIGIGPSAHSMINNERFYYSSDIEEFEVSKILYESEGKTPEEHLMLSLRTDMGFSMKKHKELFKHHPSDNFMSEAEKFEKLGLLFFKDDRIVLTEKGFLLSNTIIGDLLSKGI